MGCQQSKLKTTPAVAAEPQLIPALAVASQPAAVESCEPAVVAQGADVTCECAAETAAETPADEPVVTAPSSPEKRAFGSRTASAANATAPPAAVDAKQAMGYEDFLACAAAKENAAPARRKVAFDSETMRKTAPKTAQPSGTLSKKQREMLKKNHVSAGRRGPVASKWDKGGKAHMQTDIYLEMAAAFERMLTNAETINAHLDSR